MSFSTDVLVHVPSLQRTDDGCPRFQLPMAADDPLLKVVQEAEEGGGVEADLRIFLEAQLQTGDVYLECDPGYGFAPLTAATLPQAVPAVLVGGVAPDRLQRWQDAAAEVGGWLDGVPLDDPARVRDAVDARLEADGQVVARTSVAGFPWLMPCLVAIASSGRLLAVALSDAAAAPSWTETVAQLDVLGLAPCAVRERQGEAILVPLNAAPADGLIIAVSASCLPEAPATPADEPPAPVLPALVQEIPATAQLMPAPSPMAPLATMAPVAPIMPIAPVIPVPPIAPPSPGQVIASAVTPLPVDPVSGAGTAATQWRWIPTRDGFLFVAPHSRTGYGVAGSHLLRALQRQGVPVAFFPLGPVDPTLTPNPALQAALDAQGTYRGDLPSVRMSQAFDLAMHAGRGPRIGFPIFELDTFTRRELHHLRQLDAILVCTEWARQVCLQNGLTDRPIHVVPLGVDAAVFHPGVVPERRRAETVFLQVGKLEPRKGQRELLQAFEAAFTPKDPVRLVLACGNPFATREQMDAMLRPFRASRMAARITLITTELPALRDVATLMAGADCGVFPVRAEGWNLEALEMLAMGKAVVATHCTAHTEFLTPANARLVEAPDLETAHEGASVGRWAAWGPAQHFQLVAHLRAVHEARQAGTLGVNTAGVETAARFSWDRAASRLLEALVAVTGAPRGG